MFFPQFLSFRTSGAASHTMRERWQETLLEHTGRPWWSSHHGFSMCVIQDLVQGHHSSAQPMATTPRWQALSELPCCGSQASGHMGEKVQTTAPESFLWTDSLLSVPKCFWFCACFTPALSELGCSLLSQSPAAQAPFPQVVCAPVSMGRWCDSLAQHILELISYRVFL